MNDKVKELVEWVAEKICTIDGNEWGFTNDTTKTLFDGAPSKGIYRGRAKQLLSHPDLALIDREKKLPKYEEYYPTTTFTPRYQQARMAAWSKGQLRMLSAGYLPIIPLAEALKEDES